jgi:hypothetical protein
MRANRIMFASRSEACDLLQGARRSEERALPAIVLGVQPPESTPTVAVRSRNFSHLRYQFDRAVLNRSTTRDKRAHLRKLKGSVSNRLLGCRPIVIPFERFATVGTHGR